MANEPPEKQPPSAAGDGEQKPAPAEPAKPAAAPPPAAKPAAPVGAAAPPAKPAAPPPKKEEPPKPLPLESELAKRFKAKFGAAIREAWLDRKQSILMVEREQLVEICRHARDAEEFNFLTDLTAVDWPKREKRFEIVLNLYSFPKNERLRIKTHAGDGESVPSVTQVWGAANWLERECFDMFGILFEGHPDLRRILLPEEWIGHPLRKDYDILKQDTAWVRENLGIESGQ
jgi:NADH-quinone oxidoreductase subunit C